MKELKRTITKYSETYTELVLFTELLNQVHNRKIYDFVKYKTKNEDIF